MYSSPSAVAMDSRRFHKAIVVVFCCCTTVVCVLATPLASSRRQLIQHSESQPAGPPKYPDTLTSKPIPFKWGFEAASNDLAVDAARYEDQLSALLRSPLSEWQVIPRVCTCYPFPDSLPLAKSDALLSSVL
jgi:hypothetical protein